MDSTDDEQEPSEALGAEQVDSPSDDQEDDGSGTDTHAADRINGLMRLVGKRTTERAEQEARANRAEAALADAQQRLTAYEDGAHMNAAEALTAETLVNPSVAQDSAEQELDSQPDEQPEDSGEFFDFFSDGALIGPDAEPAMTYVDPSSAPRSMSMRASHPTPTQRLQTAFNQGLDGALDKWGWRASDD